MKHTKITQQKAGTVPHGCVMIMNTHLLFLNKVARPKGLCNTTESPKTVALLAVRLFCDRQQPSQQLGKTCLHFSSQHTNKVQQPEQIIERNKVLWVL